MYKTSQTIDATAMRSLTTNEIEAVAGGYFSTFEPLGDRRVVGCGTMVLIDRMIKRMSGMR